MENKISQWFSTKTNKEIIFPISVPTMQQRLQSAFASLKMESGGFLSFANKYSGYLDGAEVDLDVKLYGRSRRKYNMHGQLFADPKGTRLVMTVTDENYVFLLLPFPLVVIFYGLQTGMIARIVLMILFTFLYVAVASWHRTSATRTICRKLHEIATYG